MTFWWCFGVSFYGLYGEDGRKRLLLHEGGVPGDVSKEGGAHESEKRGDGARWEGGWVGGCSGEGMTSWVKES